MRSTQSAHLWPYDSASDAVVITDDHVELDSLTRQVQAGDPILIDPGSATSNFAIGSVVGFAQEPVPARANPNRSVKRRARRLSASSKTNLLKSPQAARNPQRSDRWPRSA